ncbi:MAG TPA: hypothetical protein VIV55_09825 [Flavobacterium sp.]
MEFSKLMDEVENTFDSWVKNDLDDQFFGDLEFMQKEFLSCIQEKINSRFLMLTSEELQNEMQGYHRSMEGYD